VTDAVDRLLTDRQLFLEGLATLQDNAAGMLQLGEQLRKIMHAAPARMSLETLSVAEPMRTLAELGNARSVGVLNWSTVEIQVGHAGRSATAGNGVPVPARSWLLLPLEVNMLDVGADAADLALAGEARVAVIRFDHGLPLMAGTLGGVPLPLGDTLTFAGATDPAGGVAAGTVWVTTPRLTGVYRAQATVSQTGAALDNPTNPLLLNGAQAIGSLISYQRSAEGPWPMTDLPRVTLLDRALALSLATRTIVNGGWSGSLAITRIA
jgi:hypothetical protein